MQGDIIREERLNIDDKPPSVFQHPYSLFKNPVKLVKVGLPLRAVSG